MSIWARRYAAWGLFFLTISALVVSWLAVIQLRDIAHTEARARARLVAEAIADQVQLAINVGIPVDQLVGVDELFLARMQSFRGMLRAALIDPDDQVLHEQSAASASALAPVIIPIVLRDERVARLELTWREPALRALSIPWGVPLLSLVAIIAGLAGEALRYGMAGVIMRRELLVHAVCQHIAAGQLMTRPPRLGRRDFDERLPWLAQQLRYAGEQHMRVERLAQSLRQTEPDFDKRQELDRVLEQANGNDRFTPADIADIPAVSRAALQRWRGILLGLLAWSPVLGLAGLHAAWSAVAAVLLLAALLGVARRAGWWDGRSQARQGAFLGASVFGPGLALLTQLTVAPRQFLLLGSFGYMVLIICGVAALVLPWMCNLVRSAESTASEVHHAA